MQTPTLELSTTTSARRRPTQFQMNRSYFLVSCVRTLQASLQHEVRTLKPGIWAGAMDVYAGCWAYSCRHVCNVCAFVWFTLVTDVSNRSKPQYSCLWLANCTLPRAYFLDISIQCSMTVLYASLTLSYSNKIKNAPLNSGPGGALDECHSTPRATGCTVHVSRAFRVSEHSASVPPAPLLRF